MPKVKSKKIIGDLFYTIMATVVMNFVLQIIIYPLITRFYGEEVTGNILYFIGFIYIIPQALGTALNNTRLVARKSCDVANTDFKGFVIIFSAFSAVVCGSIGFFDSFNLIFAIFYGVFSIVYLLRIYAQVEFRLNLKFKEYLLYYCIISVGYLLGLGLYFLTDLWLLIFVTGEASALAYSLIKGNLFKKDSPIANKKILSKSLILILFSTIIRDCVNQFDKVILKLVISSNLVTHYHVVSLIAKTMQMLVQPINTLILSYLTVKGTALTKKNLLKFTAISLGCGAIFYGICIAGTPLFIKLFYPDLFDDVIHYNLIVNLGLISGFVASMFMAILLSQEKTVVHMVIQCVWGVCYIITAYIFVNMYALWGLAFVTLIANSLKLIAVIIYLFMSKDTTEKIKSQTKR